MTKEKITAMNRILRAIEKAYEDGFQVVFASDPEGNNWNKVNPLYMLHNDSNEKYIALGVFEYIPEDEIFNINE